MPTVRDPIQSAIDDYFSGSMDNVKLSILQILVSNGSITQKTSNSLVKMKKKIMKERNPAPAPAPAPAPPPPPKPKPKPKPTKSVKKKTKKQLEEEEKQEIESQFEARQAVWDTHPIHYTLHPDYEVFQSEAYGGLGEDDADRRNRLVREQKLRDADAREGIRTRAKIKRIQDPTTADISKFRTFWDSPDRGGDTDTEIIFLDEEEGRYEKQPEIAEGKYPLMMIIWEDESVDNDDGKVLVYAKPIKGGMSLNRVILMTESTIQGFGGDIDSEYLSDGHEVALLTLDQAKELYEPDVGINDGFMDDVEGGFQFYELEEINAILPAWLSEMGDDDELQKDNMYGDDDSDIDEDDI